MPIVLTQLIPANALLTGYAVAKELALQSVAQFGAVRGAGAGIGPGSCCAALAVVPAPPGYPAANQLVGFGAAPPGGGNPPPVFGAALPFTVIFGNSQMAAGGLALGPLGGHAERAALTAAGLAGRPLYPLPGIPAPQAVLFVELHPCGACANWLNGLGGGVPNPFDGVINGGGPTTLHVWWRWGYPGAAGVPGAPPGVTGVAAMNLFHGLTLPAQLADINNPLSW